jgi:hypothetical protein
MSTWRFRTFAELTADCDAELASITSGGTAIFGEVRRYMGTSWASVKAVIDTMELPAAVVLLGGSMQPKEGGRNKRIVDVTVCIRGTFSGDEEGPDSVFALADLAIQHFMPAQSSRGVQFVKNDVIWEPKGVDIVVDEDVADAVLVQLEAIDFRIERTDFS